MANEPQMDQNGNVQLAFPSLSLSPILLNFSFLDSQLHVAAEPHDEVDEDLEVPALYENSGRDNVSDEGYEADYGELFSDNDSTLDNITNLPLAERDDGAASDNSFRGYTFYDSSSEVSGDDDEPSAARKPIKVGDQETGEDSPSADDSAEEGEQKHSDD